MELTCLKIYISSVLVTILIHEINGRVEPLSYIPTQLQHYLDICRGTGDLTQQPGEMVFWLAMNKYTSRFVKERPNMSPQQITFFQNSLQEAFSPLYAPAGKRKKRQRGGANGPRVRKELRAMTLVERRRYFTALNNLKRDTRLPPNIYNFLAEMHAGENVDRAHFGPSFAPWHRLYLWILEFFLRQHDPTVSIPYWNSRLDNDMDDSTDTPIFSPAFFGDGVGEVRSGPLASWRQIDPANIIVRNVQPMQLYTYEGIQNIIRRTRAQDIFVPTALAESNFEQQHGFGHVFVGGTMNDLNTAAFDPLFFSHHCFVDQIWERFKDNQRRSFIDPQSDYPFIENDPRFDERHRPTATAGFDTLAGANTWTMAAGNLNVFSDFVTYEPTPICPACGGSRFLVCNRNLNPPRCVSRSRTELRGAGLLMPLQSLNAGQGRKKRQVHHPEHYEAATCPRKSFLNDIDLRHYGFTPMLYGLNQQAFAHIPVKIVTKRAQDYTHFNKYTLDPTMANQGHLGLKSTFLQSPIQNKYSYCSKDQSSVGRIKIVGYGLNHKSYSEEYVLVDNRLAVSESIGYLPVKLPEAGVPTEVMIAAFDSCGRVCKPYCKQTAEGGMDSQFTGAVRVSAVQPLQYAYSYSDATLLVWDVPSQTACPTINYSNIPISFFCDYSEDWIWSTGGSNLGAPNILTNPPVDIHLNRNRITINPPGHHPIVVQNTRRGNGMGRGISSLRRGSLAPAPRGRGDFIHLVSNRPHTYTRSRVRRGQTGFGRRGGRVYLIDA